MTRLRFVLLSLVVLVAGPAFAQTNIAGDWDMTIDSPQGSRTVPVSLKLDGDKITGVFKSPTAELPIAGTLTGSDVKLSFTIAMQGTPLEITMTGKMDGEAMSGKADFGGFAEGTFSAKRPAAAAAPAATPAAASTAPSAPGAGLAGTWDVTLKTGAGDYPVTATLTEDAGKVEGTFATQMGELSVSGTHEGHTLKLSMIAKTPQGDIPVSLTGDVDGDAVVNGKADFGGMGQGEWTAKRKQ